MPAALEQIREWHPRFGNASDDDIRRVPFTEEDARLVYAREHGFEGWEDLVTRAPSLSDGGAGEEPFIAAYTALEIGDLPRLQALLNAHRLGSRPRY